MIFAHDSRYDVITAEIKNNPYRLAVRIFLHTFASRLYIIIYII